MQSFEVTYYDGKSSNARQITLEVRDNVVLLKELGIGYNFDMLGVGVKLKGTPQTIDFGDGSYCVLKTDDHFSLPNAGFSRFVLWLESKMRYALLSLFILAGVAVFILTYGGEMLADLLADKIPQSVIERVSKEALRSLDEEYFRESNLTKEQQEHIASSFGKLFAQEEQNYKIHFRESSWFGANAFALPSGDIVLLDALVKMDEDEKYRGIMAVLAHEKGHVEYRHGVKMVIKSSVTSALLGYLVGDFSGLMTSVGAFIMEAQYSQEFEKEADAYAIAVMDGNNISTKYIADIFEKLNSDAADNVSKMFSSHPAMGERIKNFREDRE
ncbi:MAG: M48 family metallopeptidase [Campylobacteraceae bacterium]|jgi:Zn-dependent protease with chaperone function|nr:M48 family metallopeptidase [Campylobacteraceae bacterium]